MLVLHNNDTAPLQLPELTLTPLVQETSLAKYDLTLNITEQADGLILHWDHNTDLFATSSIARLAGHFETLLDNLLAAPDDNVFTVNLLSETEHEQQLTAIKAPQSNSVVE